MKGIDIKIFWIVITLSLIAGYWIFDENFEQYSNLITFLSIMLGFIMTSLSILFNSPLKKTLFDRKINKYQTELHRLKDFYKHFIIFEVISIFLLFITPEYIFTVPIKSQNINFGRYLLISPILIGTLYCFYKVFFDLLKIFTHPTNEK